MRQTTLDLAVVYRWKDTSRVLLGHLIIHLEQGQLLPESQCIFRARIYTDGMILIFSSHAKQCQKYNRNR